MDCITKRRRKTSSKAKAGDDAYRIVRKRVSSLKPSPENLQLYKRVDADEHDMFKLAESIRKEGLHDPLLITLDGFIVSGHRRHVALQVIGQVLAPCRVLPVRRADMTTDDYVALLRDCNRQRHKSVAEQVREELVDIDPEKAIQNLYSRRQSSINGYIQNGVSTLAIEGASRRWNISYEKAEHVQHVKKVVFEDRRGYWPLSVRSVHYPLLNYKFWRNVRLKLPYKNDDRSYHATSDLITRMRLTGQIPWAAISDETRPIKTFRAFEDVRQFVRQEVRNLFGGYWRNYLQSQPNYIEVMVEKNTIYNMALRVTEKFQIPTGSARGFSSIDLWHEVYDRYIASEKQRLILIIVSDYDPEGELIPHVAGRTLRDDFGVTDIEIIKAGVTREQITKYELPPQNFAKETSSNLDWFIERNGGDRNVYEVEALEPAAMLRDLEDMITSVLDMNLFNSEVMAENQEATYLEAAQVKATEALEGLGD